MRAYVYEQLTCCVGIATNAVVILLAASIAFVLKRYLGYLSMRRRTNIQFLPLVDPIRGSLSAIAFQNDISTRDTILTKMRSHKDQTSLAFMAGPVVGVCSRDADLYQKVYATDARKHINRVNLGIPLDTIDKSLLEAEDQNWFRTRSAIGSIMSKRSFVKHHVEEDLLGLVNKFMASLERRLSRSRDNVIHKGTSLFRTYTMATILTTGFDASDEINFDKDHGQYADLFVETTKQMYTIWGRIGLYLPSVRKMIAWLGEHVELNPLHGYVKKRMMELMRDNVVETNRRSGANKTTTLKEEAETKRDLDDDKGKFRFIHAMVDLYARKRLTKDELVGNAFFMIWAGYETSADTLTALMWFMAKHQDCQQKLHADIIKNGKESVYLDWCIKETLRLYPPARTARLIGEDFQHKGLKFLKGMLLILDPVTLHYEAGYWGQDVEQFRPERFEKMDTFHPAQYVPFGLGIRNCVGQPLAETNMKLLSVNILLKYRICKTPTTPEHELKSAVGPTAVITNTLGEEISLGFEPRQ